MRRSARFIIYIANTPAQRPRACFGCCSAAPLQFYGISHYRVVIRHQHNIMFQIVETAARDAERKVREELDKKIRMIEEVAIYFKSVIH